MQTHNNSMNCKPSTYTIDKEKEKAITLTLGKEPKCKKFSSSKIDIPIKIFETVKPDSYSCSETMYSLSCSEEDDSKDTQEKERKFTHLKDGQDLDLNELIEKVTTNQLEATQIQFEEIETLQNQISFFDQLSAHLTNFVGLNGTTTVTTTAAFAYGIATVATGGLANFFFGAGALVVSANEFAKMLKKYLNDKGASDHLKAMEMILTNLEAKREKSNALIQEAKAKNEMIGKGLIEIEKKIEDLKSELANSSGLVHEAKSIALEIAIKRKANLETELVILKDAIKEGALANAMTHKQHKLIDDLSNNLSAVDFNENNFVNILAQVKETLIEIRDDCLKIEEHQTNANRLLINAFMCCRETKNLEYQSELMIQKMELAQEKQKNAENIAVEAQETVQKITHEKEALAEINEALLQINDEIKNDNEKLQDNLQAQKDTVGFGFTSGFYGNTATATSTALGFITLGLPGGIVGGLAGVYVSPTVTSLAHYYRKGNTAIDAVKLDEAFKLCSNNLSKLEIFEPNAPIAIQAKFTYNNAPIYGAGTLKGLLNAGITVCNFVGEYFGAEKMEYVKSKRAGYINCQIGQITLPQLYFYGHPDYNPNFSAYGAIFTNDQEQLCKLLTIALEKNKICPQVLLKFFYQMQSVDVEGRKIVMIHKDSKEIKFLKRKCIGKKLLSHSEAVKGENKSGCC